MCKQMYKRKKKQDEYIYLGKYSVVDWLLKLKTLFLAFFMFVEASFKCK